jgi:hypothetical protein
MFGFVNIKSFFQINQKSAPAKPLQSNTGTETQWQQFCAVELEASLEVAVRLLEKS